MVATLLGFGQSASISGQVTDKLSGEGIPGVHVVINDTQQGSYTDFQGHFKLSQTPGTYQLHFSAIGYETVSLSDFKLTANEVVDLRIELQEDEVLLEGVVVEATADLSNQNVLLLERKRGSFAKESLSSQYLQKLGVSQVEEGLTKISGITKTQNGIYVRGLGDRYNNLYFNDLSIPSANPSRKVLELDIVPTDVVRNVDVSKIYRSDQFSDVSGASIYIYTQTPTADDFIRVGFGLGFNTQTTGQTLNLSEDSQYQYLGFTGQRRNAPVPIDGNDFIARLGSENGQGFDTGFAPQQVVAPPDHNWKVQFRKSYENDGQKFGILFSTSYQNAYETDRGLNLVLDAAQAPINHFIRRRDTRSTRLNSLLGLQYQVAKKWKVDLNYLFINNSKNQFITSEGSTIDFEALKRTRNRYLEKRLNSIQLHSKLEIVPDKLTWNVSSGIGIASTDEPDRRDLTFIAQSGENTGSINRNIAAENGRYYQQLDEQENNLRTELKYQLGKTNRGSQEVTVGYQFRDKGRSTDFRTFTLITGDLATDQIDLNRLDDLFSSQNFVNGSFSYRDTNGGERQSRVLRTIQAGYMLYRIQLADKWEFIPGLRMESTDQQVFFKLLGTPLEAPFQLQSFQENNFLINLNSRYSFTSDRQLRFGLSQTLTRPNFSELIPAPQVNENLQSTVGRPELINSKIWNLDLRFDIFPKAVELISLGAFYKHIKNPIEQVRSGENFISFFNVASADVAGIEFEWQKDISYLVKGLSFWGNASLLFSKVNTDPSQLEDMDTRDLLTNVTNTSRTLQGASPYVFNLSLAHEQQIFQEWESKLFAHYHVFDKRVLHVGTQQRGDEFELAVHTLDFIWQHQSSSGFGFTIKANNVLNPAIQTLQSAGPQASRDRITQSYREGINFSVSLSWTLYGYQQ